MKLKLFLLMVGGLSANVGQAVTGGGPYDAYAGSIRSVLNRVDGNADPDRVVDLMQRARHFRYRMKHPFRAAPPEMTDATREGDCKDKSLWLAWRMNDESVRYVIGRARPTSDGLHAWLLWKNDGYWWVLDPTNYDQPLRADRLPPGNYVAMYQWRK